MSSDDVATPPPPPAAPPIGHPISALLAKSGLDGAVRAAAGIAVPIAIAVVEPTGDLVAFIKMDGAPYSAVELAQQKALTAARYRRPTRAFFDNLSAGHTSFLTFPGVLGAPGGISSYCQENWPAASA